MIHVRALRELNYISDSDLSKELLHLLEAKSLPSKSFISPKAKKIHQIMIPERTRGESVLDILTEC